VTCFIASAPAFTGQAQVANGASGLLIEVLGEAGRHAAAPWEWPRCRWIPRRGRADRRGRFAGACVRIQLGWFDERLAKRIADIAAGQLAPPPARRRHGHGRAPAENGADGVEVLMLKRPRDEVRAGAYVFPGGSVDPADGATKIGWHGRMPPTSASGWARPRS